MSLVNYGFVKVLFINLRGLLPAVYFYSFISKVPVNSIVEFKIIFK